MTGLQPEHQNPSKGVALTNWVMSRAMGFLDRRASRRGFLVGSAVAGSAVAVSGVDLVIKPTTAYAAITDCPGGACRDGYTEFCCAINNGLNACPPGSFAGGWWRADYSSFCNGTRYYIDCMENCGAFGIGGNWCAGTHECRCANGCDTRRVYCNYFRYGQCHQEIQFSGPIACRVVTCVPPYTVAEWACTTALAVDNSTAEHAGNCPPAPPPPPPLPPPSAVLATFGAPAVTGAGTGMFFSRIPGGAVAHMSWSGASFGSWGTFTPTINSGLTAAHDATGTYVFGRGADFALWYRQLSAGAWSGWQSLGGVVTSNQSAVVDPQGLFVFARGLDDWTWYRQRTASGWANWASLGGTARSEPVAVSHSSGLYVFVTGIDAGVWYRRLSGGTWSGWISLGPTATSKVAAVASSAGVFAFMRGKDNQIWWRRTTNGVSWSAWASLQGYATSDPVAVSDPSGVYVFIRGWENGVWYKRFSGGAWSGGDWISLGPSILSDPMAVSDGSGLFVFGQGVDYGAWYRRLAGGSWSSWQFLGRPIEPILA
jgi:hypothetical protein